MQAIVPYAWMFQCLTGVSKDCCRDTYRLPWRFRNDHMRGPMMTT